jgi:hypothetical protein
MASYFKTSEFDSRLEPGSGKNMNPKFLEKLNKARELYGKPMQVTSGFRVRADYDRLKRQGYEVSMTSAHFIGRAVDVRPVSGVLDTWPEWEVFLNCFWEAGFRRFGIMANTLHVDDDPTKRSPASWQYKNTDAKIYAAVLAWMVEKRKGEKARRKL